jgi:glycosyltransferase involved in cell wall biosynthesis
MQSLISIVIPCYNDWQYVEEAVNSALNQSYRNIEVIVVDDGSDAKTKGVLKGLESKITKLITQENQGQSKARNIGIREAKGEYVLVLDSDDFIESGYCEKIVASLQSDENIKLVVCQTNLCFENGETKKYLPKGGYIEDFLFSNAATGTSAFRIKDWKECGGYDETMKKGFEDWEFFIRLLKEGGYCFVIPEVLYHYRKRNNSTTSTANSKKHELLRYIFNKNRDLYTENFEQYTDYLLTLIQKEEIDKKKKISSIDYRIGNVVLKPFRLVKNLMRKF